MVGAESQTLSLEEVISTHFGAAGKTLSGLYCRRSADREDGHGAEGDEGLEGEHRGPVLLICGRERSNWFCQSEGMSIVYMPFSAWVCFPQLLDLLGLITA